MLPEAPDDEVEDFVLLPDFLPVVDVDVAPEAPAPDLLADDDDLLPEPDFEPPEAELLPDLPVAPVAPEVPAEPEAPDLFSPPDTAPWPTLISELAKDWLETPEPDERLLSVLLPLVRLVVPPDWALPVPEFVLPPVVAPEAEVPDCIEPCMGFLPSF